MKRLLFLLALILLVSCGEETTQYAQAGMNVAASVAELPACSRENNGELAYVKAEGSMRICAEGAWVATKESIRDTFYLTGDLSCETEELSDRSGLRIVCNGDSVGVVLYGANGADGLAGKDGIDGKDGSDGKDVVLKTDSLENDSERVALSLDSLAGYSQKGPFLKGSTVFLYELSDGRTLKQTNGNFTSVITRDDGRYKFTARDMVSQYAMIVVEGNFRNEVTGEPSVSPIRLRALTDMRKHGDANVNLLTHLEFDRVYYLVTREKMTVKQAKRQAQKEVFSAFHIDTTGLAGTSEDLDVFGATDADAALLAISILMQRDTNETALSVLMTEIANDLETDGQWTDSSTRALIADWAVLADIEGQFEEFRDNVQGWGLGDGTVPEFEKYIRRFWSVEHKLGVCGDRDNPVNTVKYVSNRFSEMFYASGYADTSKTKIRFICDADSLIWRVAPDFEKDTYEALSECKAGGLYADGRIFKGSISGNNYVCDNGEMRRTVKEEDTWGRGCVSYIRDLSVVFDGQQSYYKCTEDGWKFDKERNEGYVEIDGRQYRTVTIGNLRWMAENIDVETENSYCYNDSVENCSKYGRLYTWEAALTVCPEGWHLPDTTEWDALERRVRYNEIRSTSGWEESNYGIGNDAYGFTALPAGMRVPAGYNGNQVYYSDLNYRTNFWTSTEFDKKVGTITVKYNGAYGLELLDKRLAVSVRCVQDKE